MPPLLAGGYGSLPAGGYKADWVDPAAGRTTSTESFSHSGGTRLVTPPTHAVDVALRIKRTQ